MMGRGVGGGEGGEQINFHQSLNHWKNLSLIPAKCETPEQRPAGLTMWGWQQWSQSDANWGTELLWQEVFRLLNTFLGLGAPRAPTLTAAQPAKPRAHVHTTTGAPAKTTRSAQNMVYTCSSSCGTKIYTCMCLNAGTNCTQIYNYIWNISIPFAFQAIVEIKDSTTSGESTKKKNNSKISVAH